MILPCRFLKRQVDFGEALTQSGREEIKEKLSGYKNGVEGRSPS